MIFRQFNFDGCLSYIIASSEEQKGAIIDPSHDPAPYVTFARENNLKILYCIDTHTHVDHLSLSMDLADILGAKTVMSAHAPLQREIGAGVQELFGIEKIIKANGEKRIDLYLHENERLELGDICLEALFTPGHTKDSMTLVSYGRIFTGDTLIIGQCGRTDLPGGDPEEMYESLFNTLMSLSNDMIAYPAHDYRGNINSSIGYERINNVCLNPKRTIEEFKTFLKGLFPPLGADGGKLQCGLTMAKGAGPGTEEDLNPLMKGFCVSMEHYLQSPHEETLIRTGELAAGLARRAKPFILDVREPGELEERGSIKGAVNVPVGQVASRMNELPPDLSTPLVVVCESGLRSAHAAIYLRAYGYSNVRNLEFGMREWRQEGLPVIFPHKKG